MCFPIHQRSRRDRGLLAVANISLFLGIALPYALHFNGAVERSWIEAVRGLLIGLSIGINLLVIRFGRRCSRSTAENV